MQDETRDEKGNGGVKTIAGKAISRYNAEKHAILREALTAYEGVDAKQIYDDLADDFEPEGRMQELIIEILASNYIRLQRIAKAESEMIKETMSPDEISLMGRFSDYRAQIPSRDAEKLLIYSRYQTATENRIYRALAVLKQLKAYEQSQDA
jgi:hypothetical protein